MVSENTKQLAASLDNSEELHGIDIYAMGPLSASICSPFDGPETERRFNMANCGVTTWQLSREPKFADGLPQPTPCERRDGWTHYLFE